MLNEERPEENLRVAFLGPAATFGHQAALEAFPFLSKSRFIPLPSFEAILGAIQASGTLRNTHENYQDLDYGLLPVENSTNGGVVPVLDLLVKCGRNLQGSSYSDIEIVAEHYLKIHHCLFVPRKVLEGVDGAKDVPNGASLVVTPHLEELNIKALYSHPQVWGQCDKFLSSNYPMADAERINVSSTSAAATFVKQHSAPEQAGETAMTQVPKSTKAGNKAAVCSYLAGSQNNLACIATNIEDEPGANTTRFFIIRNRTRSRTPCHGSAVCQTTGRSLPLPTPTLPPSNENPHAISCKSLITFTISHSKPGSLAGALGVFQKHGFNLTSINTRPSRQSAWHYVFFVECDEKRAREAAESDVHVTNMFQELQLVTERATLLGSWVNRLQHPL